MTTSEHLSEVASRLLSPRKDFATKGMRKYQIKDKNEEKQISESTVTPALNAAQLTLLPH